jgi:predicted short-subunit dehydrogenase-like oxidoreductase (DUF2520 family)
MRELERDLPDDAGRDTGGEALPPIAIVGAGRVGSAIERAALGSGLRAESAGREASLDAAGRAEVALLCVPDDTIEEACEGLVAAIPPLRFVGHVSGATGLGALRAAADAGAETFSLHPLQTVPDSAANLTGAPCAVAGSSAEALALATALGEGLGMRPFHVPEELRGAYHATASMASNFLVALEESAAGLLERAGVGDARELLAPLVLRSAANWAERGPAALTGPIARGDVATVERHLAAIRELAPELAGLYEELAARTRALAAQRQEVAP